MIHLIALSGTSLAGNSAAILALAAAGRVAYSARQDALASETPLAPLIAIVGCDGSGKSTLAADMLQELNQGQPASTHRAEVCYLGLGSGELGNKIKRWPLIGGAVERLLSKKATQTRTKGQRVPGLPTALVVYGFSLLRRRRFRQMLALRRKGMIVITDRYPQIEVPGFFDGPGLSAATPGNRLIGWLAARELRMYQWMASFHPDVVIRLNVDAETAFARKPDHKLSLLREKVAATSLLKFDGAEIVELDSHAAYTQVRGQAFEVASHAIDAASRNFAIAA